MSLRKNPVHPSARAASTVDEGNNAPPSGGDPQEMSFSAPPAIQQAPAQQAPAQQAPAQQAPAQQAPAQQAAPAATSLTAAEIAELNRRMTAAEAERDQALAAAAERTRQVEQNGLAEIAELRRQLELRQSELQTYQTQATERELADMMQIDRSALSHLDAETADELTQNVLRPVLERVQKSMASRMEQVSNSVTQLQTEFQRRYQDMSDREKTERRIRINERLLHAVPDFEALNQTAAFNEFKKRVPPGGRQSFGDAMTDAYQAGDVDYIVEQVNVFRSGRPRLSDVADIDLSREAAVQAQAPGNEPRYTYKDLDDAKIKFQRGLMDRKTFRQFMESFEAAERAKRVS